MEQCKKCVFRDEEYDLRNQPDTIVEGEGIERHSCIQYRNGIPQSILEDTAPCDFHIDKLKQTP